VRHGNGLGQKTLAQHVGQALLGGGRTPLLDQLALVPDRKTHLGPRQRVAAHRLDAVGQFGGVGFQELAACRGREEQLFDLDRGAGGAGGRAQLTGAAVQHRGGGVIGGA
jgi:hypothetical protein